ncbi:MAG: ABC transporter ATP-binding protein, partial [Lentisphaerae bacterium]
MSEVESPRFSARKQWVYRRLLGYVKPYRWMLVVGILAGFLSGGSTVGVLTSIPNVVVPLQKNVATAPSSATTSKPGSLDNAGTQKPVPEARHKKKSWLQKLNPAPALAKRFGFGRIDPQHQQVTFPLMVFLCAVLGLMLVLRAAATVLNRYCLRSVGIRVVQDLRNELFRHIENQSLRFFATHDVGSLISRVNNDTATIEQAVSSSIADLTRAPIQVLGVLSFLILFTVERQIYSIWIFSIAAVLLVMIPIAILSRKIKGYVGKALQKISDLTGRMHEVFSGIRVVKAFHTEALEEKAFRAVNTRYIRQLLKALRAELGITVALETVNVTIACALIVYCFMIHLTLSDLAQLTMAAILTYEPCKRLAKVNTQIQRSKAAAERIFQLLDIHQELPEAPDPVVIDEFREEIRFENVSFAYEPGKKAISDLSFSIPKGQVIAFVGKAGSGKSTIANLMARFYDPDEGRILMDGIDLRNIEIASLRRLIGVVTQDTILFNQSIASNIAYGEEQPDMERVIEAAQRARAHEFIVQRPEGYETIVGEKGFTLSGGQKQRIAIARAIYKNPQILILDEATSSLDSVTEQLVQEALEELMRERTVFAIAHRLSTIRNAHRIFVLDEGRIVEEGN